MVKAALSGDVRVTDLACLAPEVSGSTITLGYEARADDVVVTRFREVVELPASLDGSPAEVVAPLLRLLSLAASLSYFKAFAPTTLSVPGGITPPERDFVTGLISQGLGEFAYVNDLLGTLSSAVDAPELEAEPLADTRRDAHRALVAVGGGKDSIVSIEALRDAGIEIGLFSVNVYDPIRATAEVAGLPLLSAGRTLDPELLRLNAAGAPNGHIPVTAINSVIATVTALALGYDTVVFSNEASSSYGNFEWHGTTINHQWSKGIEFERLLRAALPAGSPQYVSLSRPLTELRIMRRFAQLRQYHPVFTSCNRAFRLDASKRTSWCADCPKCRFVFLCLAPFVTRDDLLAIFAGRDMFADAAQTTGFLELLGIDGLTKPLECVGEPDECRVALDLLREREDWAEYPFLKHQSIANVAVSPSERHAVFEFREGEHVLPANLEAVARAI